MGEPAGTLRWLLPRTVSFRPSLTSLCRKAQHDPSEQSDVYEALLDVVLVPVGRVSFVPCSKFFFVNLV